MRQGILTVLIGLLVMSAGCVGLLTGETITYEASAASVDDSALDSTGYELTQSNEQTVTRNVSAAGQERTVRVTNHVYQYKSTVDLGPAGEVDAGQFIVLSTPDATVAGQSLNPAVSMSNRQLVERVAGETESVEDIEFERNRTVQSLGEEREVSVFSSTTTVEGQEVDVLIHVTSFSHEGDAVIAVAVYPERADEEGNVDILLGGIQHSGD